MAEILRSEELLEQDDLTSGRSRFSNEALCVIEVGLDVASAGLLRCSERYRAHGAPLWFMVAALVE